MYCKECFNSKEAPAAIGPYSHATKVGGLVFLSGQLGIEPATGQLVQGGIAKETGRALQNIGIILTEMGLTFSNVAKTTVFLRDIADFKAVNDVYALFFTNPCPARSAVQVAALPMNASVEIEVVAVDATWGK
ncbi:MAG TPA: Rid family detoxifying hydrolase [Spirochaetales bacterium]|nr:Rid family detoxifying hydrolase [Spirochaetales bacterium]